MKRLKVLLLQEEITHYREPIYSGINEKVDLTVGYLKESNYDCERPYTTHKFDRLVFGPFTVVKGLRKYCKNFDVVVSMTDPHQLSYCGLVIFHKGFKVVDWNIGTRASYKHRYILPPPNDLYHKYARFLNRRSNAVLFYMPQPIDYCISKKLPREKFFAAYNTVKVLDKPIDWEKERTHLLFLGTLYPQKKVDELLRAYIKAVNSKSVNMLPILDIIGDGTERDKLQDLVKENNLEGHVFFHGAINDDNILFEYFENALLCISPDQAGLSVLKSMGYGVPYVTRRNAITGGERYNIIDKENGFFYDSEEDLVNIIIEAINNPLKIKAIAKNAYDFYNKHATPNKMIQGFWDAIEYAYYH